jgi:hypothetical protein
MDYWREDYRWLKVGAIVAALVVVAVFVLVKYILIGMTEAKRDAKRPPPPVGGFPVAPVPPRHRRL